MTGNTKYIAKGICDAVSEYEQAQVIDLKDLKRDMTLLKNYKRLIIGYWNDKGTANQAVLELAENLEDKEIILFGTQGADPKSDHGLSCKSIRYRDHINLK